MENPTIREGDYVVVQKIGGEHIRVMRLASKQKVLIEKLKFDAESVFGHPYGLFEVSSGKATPVCASRLVQEEGVGDIAFVLSVKELQKLSQEDVLNLKGQGITASELVSKLVEGSKSFSSRTEYSKNKYIRRKTKKHSDRVLILKPTIRLLACSYYIKDCLRVSNLRVDQLGMILQLAGVHHGKNVLVFDQVLGVVSAAVIDRLGGDGCCIHLHRGIIAQSIPCIHCMDFSEKVLLNGFFFFSVVDYIVRRVRGLQSEDSSVSRRADRLAREARGLAQLEVGVDALIIATRTVRFKDV
uniref:tRNA (adenine(58)-N(1))-methyltransferase non-catalytic subunit TRM6 n=1 Tax=Angiostrongylus cantonensis TaxID=6313 RepID=A0A0K0D1H5_ANGCA